jgi:hypothetical protein
MPFAETDISDMESPWMVTDPEVGAVGSRNYCTAKKLAAPGLLQIRAAREV